MNKEDLNKIVFSLIQSPDNFQEFADIASLEENWKQIDKSIKIQSHIALKQEDCPSCFEPIRLIYDKFLTGNNEFNLICPHCKSNLIIKSEYTGYTCEIYLEER